MTTLNRATEVADFTGRTLEGYAYRYERPSRVTDDSWRTSYYEEIVRGADSKTLRERSSFPLHRYHDTSVDLGSVQFEHSEDESALMFRAFLNQSDAANELLEQLDEWRDVSVGFTALRNAKRVTDHHGPIVQRVELRLDELSLAPTGTGLTKGAEVVARRAAQLETPRLDVLRKRLILL